VIAAPVGAVAANDAGEKGMRPMRLIASAILSLILGTVSALADVMGFQACAPDAVSKTFMNDYG
jgi:hypothetical protein